MEALLCYSHTMNCGILLYPLTKNLLVCFQDWKDSVPNTTTNLKKMIKKSFFKNKTHSSLPQNQTISHAFFVACM